LLISSELPLFSKIEHEAFVIFMNISFKWIVKRTKRKDPIMIKSITREELKERMEHGHKFHLVDVLAPETYEKKHIKGAINLPMQEVGKKARKLFEPGDDIVVYCSSFSCKASPAAAKKLDDLGFENVYDYEGGRDDWEEAGLPIETSN